MSAQQDNPNLTVTLTGRTPVTIKKENWPIVASASDEDFDGQYEFQANRKGSWKIIVRARKDGKTLVYAVYHYSTQFQSERGYDIRGGELIDARETVAAIQRVGAEIEERIPEDARYGRGIFPRLVHECIADLPPVELDAEAPATEARP